MSQKLLLTVDEAAQRLGLKATKMYELLRTGQLPSVKIGRARRIPLADLEGYVERLRAELEAQ